MNARMPILNIMGSECIFCEVGEDLSTPVPINRLRPRFRHCTHHPYNRNPSHHVPSPPRGEGQDEGHTQSLSEKIIKQGSWDKITAGAGKRVCSKGGLNILQQYFYPRKQHFKHEKHKVLGEFIMTFNKLTWSDPKSTKSKSTLKWSLFKCIRKQGEASLW